MSEALRLLERGVPGFFRDNPTEEMIKLRRQIRRQMMTTEDYIKNDADTLCSDEIALKALDQLHRGQLVLSIVKEYCDQNIKPHLVDMGPGDYWLPLGLKQKNLNFSYRPVGLQSKAKAEADQRLTNIFVDYDPYKAPVIFIANEIIEHLWNPHEIAQTADKINHTPERIVISTPMYTFADGNSTWTKSQDFCKLGHIRTFTPSEFQTEVTRMFFGYQWKMHYQQCMVMEGKLKNESK